MRKNILKVSFPIVFAGRKMSEASIFLISCCNQTTLKSNFRKEGLMQPRRHHGRGMTHLVIFHLYSGSREQRTLGLG